VTIDAVMTKPKAERRGTHADRRREAETRILEAAFNLVAQRGVDQLTLAEAGEAAGYSRALAAHYFGSRDALLGAVAQHAVHLYRDRLGGLKAAGAPGLETLLRMIAFYFDDSRGWPKRLRAFYEVTNGALRWPSIAVAVAQLNAEAVEQFAAQIRAGQAAGEIRQDLAPAPEAVVICGALRGAMNQWLVAPEAVDLDAVRDAMVAGARRALAA
jgi:AcrR family transcriptional regulator